ncbi:MAG TPA: subclass B3 metallo-beta-lactamase [Chryseosolibacter sp.]
MFKNLFSSILLVFTLSTTLPGQVATSSFVSPEWTQPYEPFRIAGDVYYVGSYDLACYLITTSAGNILINTGLADSPKMLRTNIEKLGFRYDDIKILLNTQAHFDHVAGMAEIKRDTKATVMVHEADVQVMSDGGNSDFLFGGSSSFEAVTVDRVLHDGDTISLGKTKLIALHHPGHTKGATSFMLDTRDETRTWRVLIVNIPSILPQTRISGMPSYPNVGQEYALTLEKLKTLNFDVWVASHASQFNLHDKRKPGAAYNPSAFNDRPGYEASINSIKREYDKRMKRETK